MLELQRDTRFIVDDILVQYHIASVDKPLMITFSPAGYVLTTAEAEAGTSAWGFEFFKKMGVNVISFAPIKNKHWFISAALQNYLTQLSPHLTVFPERLGYGASMGAFAHSLYYSQLQLDRLLLITPLTPPKNLMIPTAFDYCAQCQGDITLIFDPLCPEDKSHALRYPSHTKYLKLYGVGHQVIETISKIGYLKSLVMAFIANDINHAEFNKAMRGRRSVERYYSYMARNPTQKLTPSRLNIIRRHLLRWHFAHPTYFIQKLTTKWRKSIRKRLNKLSK
ncbi:hypothetical protein [Moritella yayanosii]|uniref:Alpha/beta hydrolase n=1 Tax=Moritella yayanosii TaxID=69539 RepID=A0A330LV82_9GAMM|nr:hypothetical protein [Moritella yayanosii]SQD80152.1 conserved protein of unknown function [Moritella yayanosii]